MMYIVAMVFYPAILLIPLGLMDYIFMSNWTWRKSIYIALWEFLISELFYIWVWTHIV